MILPSFEIDVITNCSVSVCTYLTSLPLDCYIGFVDCLAKYNKCQMTSPDPLHILSNHNFLGNTTDR